MKTILTLLLTLGLIQGFTQTDAVRQKHFNVKKNIAVEGFDPVSYFDGKPTEGDEKIKNHPQRVNLSVCHTCQSE